ncbi:MULTISPECIES: dephospho-CoA kinase [Shewanella]|uniref:dephospho-CoA kinase n=1 Tax=Shewanella TaxID=22 RepID=UPI000C52802F|nr:MULTISPECIES: dephospho-CoA kinase [Shewanella]NCQ45035.1 dephospho-CoA kinase [Shewanella frigidimarina]MBB1388596.1 dephospho-CoA kinase [Shewanella sp. SG44-6]NCO70977.1 dephospho-CoA kinase [Shewanella vesiculosa]NCP37094.1 dephospho-CoA kinase [Shewanella vesiculosa]NCP68813.1 dephospho-CoA kinase [Shewanella vesiculosa]
MMAKKYIVGLTGGIASGKTTVANLFAQYGIDLVDADVIAREVVSIGSDGLNAIKQHFGRGILLADNSLDRAALRAQVFNNPEQRLWLNNLLHPMIRQRMLDQVQASTSAYVIMVVPLLFENHLDSLVDTTLVVDIAPELQVSRTMQRDAVSKEQVEHILASQMTREQRLALADNIIDNQGEHEQLRSQVFRLHQQYLQQATDLETNVND